MPPEDAPDARGGQAAGLVARAPQGRAQARDAMTTNNPAPRADARRAPVPPAPPGASAAWLPALVALSLALVLVVAAYWGTASGMASIWARSDTFAHGFLIVPIALWLVWRRRADLAQLSPRPDPRALALLAAAAIAWLLADVTLTNALAHFSLVAMLVLAVPAVLGAEVARTILFPLVFLFFAVPFGEFLLPTLMEWTADFTVLALRFTGIPVFREGQRIEIPSGVWSVVEACSGIRYLIASVVVGTLYAYLSYRSTLRRVMFIAFSFLVPIIANWLRAYIIVMLGHLSGNKIAVGVDHLIYGWLFFGVVIVAMLWVGSRWQEDEPGTMLDPDRAPAAAMPGGRATVAWAAVVFVLVATLPASYARFGIHAARSGAGLPPIAEAGGWRDAGAPSAPLFRPAFVGAASESWQLLTRDGRSVALYIGYYQDQGPDRKLLSSENRLAKPGERAAAILRSRTAQLPLSGGEQAVEATDVSADGVPVVAMHWYWIDGTVTASVVRGKWATAWSQLVHRRDASAAIVIEAVDEPRGTAEATLGAFARDAWPTIAATLQKAASHGDAR
jgi:exosortase A